MRFVTGRGVPEAEMEEALALERSLAGSLLAATWTVGHQLAWAGDDPERAREHLHAYGEAMRARDSVEEVHSLLFLALLEWRTGNWDLAARYADDLLSLAAQEGAPARTPIVEMGAARVAAYRGQVDEPRADGARARTRASSASRLRRTISGCSGSCSCPPATPPPRSTRSGRRGDSPTTAASSSPAIGSSWRTRSRR